MLHGTFNFRHEVSQQLLKVTTFCSDTLFVFFSPLISRINTPRCADIQPTF